MTKIKSDRKTKPINLSRPPKSAPRPLDPQEHCCRVADPNKLVVIDRTRGECAPLSPKILGPIAQKYKPKPVKPQK